MSSNIKYNRIIMFCDFGLDDAIALMHILSRRDRYERLDIVPVGGNVKTEVAYRNAHTLLVASKTSPEGVRIVDTRAIPQRSADIPDIHGVDGIGDVLAPAMSAVPVITPEQLLSELETSASPERDCCLSLGPCTVPDMLGYVPFCTVLMGGATEEKPNYGEYEFNEALDPEAFRRYAYKATAVATLDTCHSAKLDYGRLSLGKTASLLIDRYAKMCKARNAPVAVYDYVAALAVTDPDRFDAKRVRRADGAEYNELILK